MLAFLVAISAASVNPHSAQASLKLQQSTWLTGLDDIPIHEFGLVMSHDAATGYLPGGWMHPINNWAKTQGTASDHSAKLGLGDQLNCGARAFDLRPKQKSNGDIVMHHGAIEVDHPFKDALQEVVAWANANPDELVVVYIDNADGPSGTVEKALDIATSVGLVRSNDCQHLLNMTVGEVKKMSRISGGGAVLAVPSCVSSNYDPSIECYGGHAPFRATARDEHFSSLPISLERLAELRYSESAARELKLGEDYCCYGKNKEQPLNKMWEYMDKVTKDADFNPFYMAQAHWQYSKTSVEFGVSHFSSIVWDEKESEINLKVANGINAGKWPHLNMVELDYTCDHGSDVLMALRKRVAAKYANQ